MNLSNAVAKAFSVALPRAQAQANATMVHSVVISRNSLASWNNLTKRTEYASESVVYSGQAHIWKVTGPVQVQLGDEPQFFSNTYCSIPLTAAEPMVDDIVLVTLHPSPKLVNRMFRVMDVEDGGVLPSCYRMLLQGVEASRAWREQ